MLVNTADAVNAETSVRDVQSAARAIGLQIQVHNAGTSGEIDAAFTTIGRERPDALLVGTGPFFTSRRVQLANLASRYAVPAIFHAREVTEVGGLISYGSNILDAYRQVGVYTGRILKGANRRICRSYNRASSSWSSTPRQRGSSASPCRRCCSPTPTR